MFTDWSKLQQSNSYQNYRYLIACVTWWRRWWSSCSWMHIWNL